MCKTWFFLLNVVTYCVKHYCFVVSHLCSFFYCTVDNLLILKLLKCWKIIFQDPLFRLISVKLNFFFQKWYLFPSCHFNSKKFIENCPLCNIVQWKIWLFPLIFSKSKIFNNFLNIVKATSRDIVDLLKFESWLGKLLN